MEAHSEREKLFAEMVDLQQQQPETHINAIYVGFTGEEQAATQRRGNRIALLRLQLAALDGNSG
jgi:hypothetical protein